MATKDFYFQYDGPASKMGGSENCSMFMITPKAYFDKHGFCDDRGGCVPRKLLPASFSEAMESVYFYEGSSDDGVAALTKAGFVAKDLRAAIKESWKRRK